MLKTTFISRASDGLPLCETYDTQSDEVTEQLKASARELLRKRECFAQDNKCSTVDISDQKLQ